MNVENQERTVARSQKNIGPQIDAYTCRSAQSVDWDPDETSFIEFVGSFGYLPERTFFLTLFIWNAFR